MLEEAQYSKVYQRNLLVNLSRPSVQQSRLQTDFLATTQKGEISLDDREICQELIFDTCSDLRVLGRVPQLASTYLDIVLSSAPISNKESLKIITAICIALALKFDGYNKKNALGKVLQMCGIVLKKTVAGHIELQILQILGWKLDVITSYDIISLLLQMTKCPVKLDVFVEQCGKLAEHCYIDYRLSKCSPMVIAISSARCVFSRYGKDELEMEWLFRVSKIVSIDLKAVNDCVGELTDITDGYRKTADTDDGFDDDL